MTREENGKTRGAAALVSDGLSTNSKGADPVIPVREYVQRAIDEPELLARVVHVLLAMPQDVVSSLLDDPCFRIAIDNHVPGRGGTVWMACPGDVVWKGSRSVVLKRRLVDCAVRILRTM